MCGVVSLRLVNEHVWQKLLTCHFGQSGPEAEKRMKKRCHQKSVDDKALQLLRGFFGSGIWPVERMPPARVPGVDSSQPSPYISWRPRAPILAEDEVLHPEGVVNQIIPHVVAGTNLRFRPLNHLSRLKF
jgi:hypothetical protein